MKAGMVAGTEAGTEAVTEAEMAASRLSKTSMLCLISVACMACAVACCGGGGGGSSSPSTNSGSTTTPPVVTTSHTIGGTVSGLAAGTTMVLTNNDGNATTVNQNGAYQFSVAVTNNGSYAVAVQTQPAGQLCSVANPTGTNINENITDVNVSCVSSGSSGSSGSGASIAPTLLSANYHTVVWQDNFAADASGSPNPALWAMLTGNGDEYGNTGWGNNEAEYYLPANATISSGTPHALQIQGKADTSVANHNCGNSQTPCQFSSARMTSLKNIDLSHPGFLEIQAEIPTGIGSWPAIWVLPGNTPGQAFPPSPAQLSSQPNWPAGGEIDLVEYMWLYQSPSDTTVQTSIHLPAGASSPYADSYQYVKPSLSSSASTSFHLYQLSWTSAQIVYAVDNAVVMTCVQATQACNPIDPSSPGVPGVSHWPYGGGPNQYSQYYLLMNLAIGGNAGITGSNNALVPANYNQTMVVNYVRYLTP